MKIVSGRTGSPHVTSQQFRQMLEGILGQDSYILTSGENLKPERDDVPSWMYFLCGNRNL